MREAFDVLRKEHTRARKSTLQVQSVAGAEVFIDGKWAGTAPLKVDLVPGSYRVSAALAEQVSFPHVVAVPKEGHVQLDLGFEGALARHTPLCLSASSVPAEGAAQKLAAALGAERVVLFWQEHRDGPAFYRASILETGVKVREGGVQAAVGVNKPFDALANFIVTGQGDGIIGVPGSAATPPAPTLTVSVDAVPTAPVSPPRIVGLSMVGVGVGCAVAGVVVFALGDADRTRFSMLTAGGALPPPTSAGYQEALGLLPRVQEARVVAFGLLGAGAGLAVSGALTFLLFRNQTPAAVGLMPTGHGASLTYGGSF
jgi:hypothetical protein